MTDRIIKKSRASEDFTHRAVSEEVYKLLQQGVKVVSISPWGDAGFCVHTPDSIKGETL